MKLHLNLSLRRALLAAMAAVATFASSATAGLVDARYDLQYYLDFGYNMGLFRPGATNITVKFKDGTSVSNATIPLMPNLDSYATRAEYAGSFGGGAGLVSPQYVASAAHCKEGNVYFITRSNDYSAAYSSTGYKSQAGVGSSDWSIQRLNKIVTEVAYTPYAGDDFMRNSMKLNETWLYRTGQGDPKDTNGGITTGRTPLGGLSNLSTINQNGTGTWVYRVFNREFDTANDTRPPLEISMTSGDSGSPLYAWDDANNQFVHVGFCSGGNSFSGYTGDIYICHNPTAYDNFIDSYEVKVNSFTGTEKILWGAQDATTGKGMLTQGSQSVEYTGAGSGNTVKDHLGLTFSTADSVNTQTIELQGSVNMGAGAMTFNEGSWKLTEKDTASTFNSAGFVVNGGADLTLELTASANEEWRKVGEGIMTIAGSGNNEAVLRVGGGNTVYNVVRDDDGNIIGCSLGNLGETRLDREGGYAASSIRLEAGVASIVLMRDGQFKPNSVAGDTFTFGNAGGLLNLNGHDLTWGVINQDGSGKGARIGNMTTQDGVTPNKTSTFTYTGTGTFDGCFMDEGVDSAAKLAVVYNNTAQDATWTLTGNHDIAGGYTVEAGTLVLQGTPTPHSYYNVPDDWDYASMQGSDVTVKSGAAFQLSHHAELNGNVIVENGGKFIMNQVVNADAEAISGSSRINMAGKEYTTLVGDVRLNGNSSTMTANVQSSAITKIDGSIRMENYDWEATPSLQFVKEGNGILAVSGNVGVPVVEIRGGGLVIEQANASDWHKWTIGKEGFLAAIGVEHSTALDFHVNKTSDGVFALTYDQTTALNLTNKQNLYIGAWGEVHYGNAEASLSANNEGNWLLGGGTGTLIVDFKLTGDKNLIVGNEWSSGTVHLTNVNNQIGGDIIIKGTGNRLTYTDRAALGGAGILLTYGNSLMLDDTSLLEAIKPGAEGTIALRARDGEQFNLDLSSDERASLSVGADGDYTYTGNLSVKDTYRFGGSGNLTVDTALDGTKNMTIDGQGTIGSSVTFAREDAYTGSITAGGGLNLSTPNSRGDIGIHVGHGEALASVAAMELQQGATLYMDGQSMEVRNLTAQSGSAISNNGEKAALLVLNVSEGESSTIADGVLHDQQNSAALHIVKSGTGTLTMGTNASWAGGMTISQGTVVAALSGTAYINAAGGIGNAASVITLEKEGTLQLAIGKTCGEDKGKLGNTLLPQTVLGTGTIVMSSGGEVLFSNQSKSFDGTIQLKGNTRLYVGDLRGDIGYDPISNLKALAGSTIVVEDGSQAKVTNTHRWGKQAAISTTANFTISGSGYAGASNWNILASRLTAGALAIDNNSTVYGNITLAGDAMISSSSAGTLEYYSPQSGLIPGDTSSYPNNATYGVREHLGGNIRGLILGEGKTLSIGGNESMTITADSANTYGNLVIANGNGHNSDQFALRLNGGKAVSQTSTALGKGNVTLNEGLILRLAGTGTANQSNVEYTYANNIAAGNGATLQSYNITNKLTGTVSMAEGADKTLNLATANGGVLHLAGGVSGSGTLNIGAASKVILGAGTDARAASTFTGNVVTAAGADLTLESAAAVAATTTISGTDSLTLRLAGTDDYTLGGITMSGADSALTLHFDFTQAGSSEYTTLNSSIASSATSIAIDLNMFNDITEGNYTLISGSLGNTNYTLADTYGDRLSLVVGDGSLTLQVGPEGRLYWAADSASQEWNTSDANWKVGNKGDAKAYSGTAEVMLTSTGHSTAGTRETITVSEGLKVGKVNVSSLYEINGGGSLNGTQLSVGDGGDLQLGVDATFSEGVLVNDGTLTVEGKTVTANVSAENGAEVNLNGTTLQGNMMVGSESAVNMDAASITGSVSTPASGAIALKNASLSGTFSTDSGAMMLNADNLVLSSGSFESSAQLLAGSMTVAGGAFTLKGTSEIEKLTVNSGQTATLHNVNGTMGSNKKIDTLALANGATLAIQNTTAGTSVSGVIDTLQLAGTGTIKEVQDSGYLKIGSLALAEGSTKGSLQVSKANTNGSAAYTSVIEFGSATASAGNFAGEIVLSNAKISDSQNHSLFVTLAGKEIFSDAVVKMTTQECTGGYLGLGIMADEATIGGLESSSSLGNRALLFSGESKRGVGWNTGDVDNHQMHNSAARTLIIDTDADTSSTFNGRVMNNLSIVKTGEGTQIFNGKSTGHGSHNFNGSIEVQEGTLAFTGGSLGMLTAASSVTVNGGTLDISSYDFSSGPLAVNNFSFSEDSVLALGNLQADTTYNFFTTALENWMSLTADNFTINGTALSDWQRASLNLGMDGSFSYSIDSWNLVWKGGSEGNWTTASGNEAWQTTDASADGSTTSTGFSNGDNVTFESGTTVTLGSDIMVSTMNVNSGTVVVKDSGSFAFNAGTVNVAANSHMQMWGDTGNAGADNVLSKVVMAEGATLSTNNRAAVSAATTVDTLVLTGKTANLKDVHHSGYIKVNELRLGEGIASSKLVLTKTSDSANVSVFEFGGASTDAGNFIGTLELIGGAEINSSSGARSAGIIISHNTIARNAAISLSSNTSGHSDSYLTLGINAANATIAGLSSGSSLGNHAVLYSGAVMSNEAWGESKIDNGSTRTLTIETEKGTEYTFYGKVVNTDSSKLNLVKSGEGTQNFLGSGSFGSVTVKEGTLTLGGSMTVEVSSNANRTFEVAQDAKLTISSSATFTNTGSVKLNKTGAGTMIVNSKISQNWLDILAGTFEVGYTGDDGNTITNIDAGISGRATGQVLVKEGAKLTSTTIWMKNGTIALEEGGMLDYKGATIIGEAASSTAIIERTNKNDGGEYTGLTDSKITISGARVKSTVAGATISNKLTNSSVENAGGGVLTVTNTDNTLSGVVASEGDVTLQNLAAATSLNLLEIAAGRSVNAYVGTNVNEKQTVTVSGTALLSGTSTLNTSLTLNAGATLDMVDMCAGAAMVSGALTFDGQLTMGDKLLAILDEMSSWENHELTLITGLDSFTFDGVEVEDGSMLQASTYFSNVSDTISVSYRVSGDVGSLVLVSMDVVPEPTTSTLSLLALAGLCARRRRKD